MGIAQSSRLQLNGDARSCLDKVRAQNFRKKTSENSETKFGKTFGKKKSEKTTLENTEKSKRNPKKPL